MKRTLLLTGIALVACLELIPEPKSGPRFDQRDSKASAARVEAGLPAVTQGDRTEQRSLTEWMEALAVPGVSIAVIDDNRIVWAKAYGVTTPGPLGSPVKPDTVFQAASIAKPVAALAVLHHVERGTFELDADINGYLQSWRLPEGELQGGETVTIRRLLAHTAGITPGGFQGYARTEPLPGIKQIVEGAAPATNPAARVLAKPGSEVAYSGLGYSLLQLALEEHLEQSFEMIVQDSVLLPLALQDSSFDQVLSDEDMERAARGHLGIGAGVDGGWRVYPELAAAGLWTTPTDLATLALDVARSKRDGSGRLLSRDMARQMLAPQEVLAPQGDGMGLGFVVRGDGAFGYFAHSGGNPGYFAHLEMLADTGQGIVIMTNAEAGQALASLIVASVANEYAWPLLDRRIVSPDRVERVFAQLDRVANNRVIAEVAPAVLSRYIGKYELAPGMLFDITLDHGQLQLRLGDQPQFPMFPQSENRFFLKAVDAQITFVMDEAGQPASLILHQGGRNQQAARVD